MNRRMLVHCRWERLACSGNSRPLCACICSNARTVKSRSQYDIAGSLAPHSTLSRRVLAEKTLPDVDNGTTPTTRSLSSAAGSVFPARTAKSGRAPPFLIFRDCVSFIGSSDKHQLLYQPPQSGKAYQNSECVLPLLPAAEPRRNSRTCSHGIGCTPRGRPPTNHLGQHVCSTAGNAS